MMENLTEYQTVGLTKEEILEFCLENERTRNFSRRLKGLNIGMSSGTSGNKGVEIVSRREEMYLKTALLSRFDFPAFQKITLAFILRVSAPAFNFNIFGNTLTYISQLDSLQNIIRKLEKLQPTIISAPPSMLKLLAGEIEHKRLSVCPMRVVSYAEVLYPDVKKYIEKHFSCPVMEIYKCTEGPIAISCKHGSLHINEDLVAVETLNDDGTPTPCGNSCRKLIVSDLHKLSQPIIRYELNDVVTISTRQCPCGSNFRVIERIDGRADDLLWGIKRDTKEAHFIYQDYIARLIISVSDAIDDFQVIQKSYYTVEVRIKLKYPREELHFDDIKNRIVSGVRGIFSEYGCIEPTVDFIYADPILDINSGKLSRIICRIRQ